MIFCLHKLSTLHQLRDILHLRFQLVTLTFQSDQRSSFPIFWKARVWLYNSLPLIRTLYLALFARYSASKISVSDLDLSGSPKVKNFNFVGKPTCDLIMVSCEYELSISYRLRDITHQRLQLMTLTFQGHRRSNISPFWEADIGLYNDLLWIRTVYLVPFARYSASKISVSDLSGSPKVKYFTFFGKPIWDFIMAFWWYELSISHHSRDIPHARFRLMTSTYM